MFKSYSHRPLQKKLFLGPWNKEKHHNFGIFQTIFIYKHSGIYKIREALTGPADAAQE